MSDGELADIGMIGVGVMGQNMALNMNDHGFKVCVYNRTYPEVHEFLSKEAKDTDIIGSKSLEEMVSKLKSPKWIMMLVTAGKPVDDVIGKLVPLLNPGDIVIDGGNSEYMDSIRREKFLRERGLYFVGSGVSGGEEGARRGPSLMPGGSPGAWPYIKDIFQAIAAKVENQPCCDWVGSGGAGHFVKMVHNGIEYGDMQLICEAYHLLKSLLGLSNDEMAEVFEEWNRGELESFLVEITRDILFYKDKKGVSELDNIYDVAGQKGTGKWTVTCSLDHKTPLTLIDEAVQARCLSALKEERVFAATKLAGPKECFGKDDLQISDIKKALYASKIISYAQGFALMKSVSDKLNWDLNLGAIALMWRGGCIIRSKFLGAIKDAFDKNPQLSNLLLDDFFEHAMQSCIESWKKVMNCSARRGIPTPAFSSALSFFNGYRAEWLPSDSMQISPTTPSSEQGYSSLEMQDNSGQFIEMIFEGIEYGHSQLLLESYHLIQSTLKLNDDQSIQLYKDWSEEALDSAAVEHFIDVLERKAEDVVAVQDNSGKWAVMCSLDYGMPLTVISQALQASYLTLIKPERLTASKEYSKLQYQKSEEIDNFVGKVKRAVHASMIVSSAQVFMLMREVSKTLGWNLNLGVIAGEKACSSKSKLLTAISHAFERNAGLANILFDDFFKRSIESYQTAVAMDDWREVIAAAFERDIPTAALAASLSFYDGYRTERLPANLIQALRDCFGAHTYSLVDAPEVFVHTNWTGRGGRVTAST